MTDEPKLPPGYRTWFHDSIGGWVFLRDATQPGLRHGDHELIEANRAHGEDGCVYGMQSACIRAVIKMQQKFDANPDYISERMNEVNKVELQSTGQAKALLEKESDTPAKTLQVAALQKRSTELEGLLKYYEDLQVWEKEAEEKAEADEAARKIDPLHGYQVSMEDAPEHDGPSVCVIMVQDTFFRTECLEIYRSHEAEGKSADYCDDAVSDRLGELEVEWMKEQDGHALEHDAFETTIVLVAPNYDSAKKRLAEMFEADPDRWLNMAGWPRFVIHEQVERTPF